MPRYLSANSVPKKLFADKDKYVRQISEHIFSPNGGDCAYYPSNIFKQGRSILETILNYFKLFNV